MSGSLVYGLHAVRAVLERRPGDVLRLSVAAARDDARVRELRDFAASRGVKAAAANPASLIRQESHSPQARPSSSGA